MIVKDESTPIDDPSGLDETRTERRYRGVHESILDAIWGLIVENVDRSLSITEIADNADIAQGTFYNHFHDLDDALRECLDRDLQKYTAATDALITSDMDAVARWAALTGVVVARVIKYPEWGRFASVMYSSPLWPRTDSPSPSRVVIDEGIAEGTMTVSDPDLAYRINHHMHLALADRSMDEGTVTVGQALHDLLMPGAALLGVDPTRIQPLIDHLVPQLEAFVWDH